MHVGQNSHIYLVWLVETVWHQGNLFHARWAKQPHILSVACRDGLASRKSVPGMVGKIDIYIYIYIYISSVASRDGLASRKFVPGMEGKTTTYIECGL